MPRQKFQSRQEYLRLAEGHCTSSSAWDSGLFRKHQYDKRQVDFIGYDFRSDNCLIATACEGQVINTISPVAGPNLTSRLQAMLPPSQRLP